MNSIRRYLLVSLLAAMVLATGLIGMFVYFNTKHELDELFDAHLQQIARTVLYQQQDLGSAARTKLPIPVTGLRTPFKVEEDFLIQVWGGNGDLFYSSYPAIKLPLRISQKIGTLTFENEEWSSFTLSSPDWLVQVSQPLQSRSASTQELSFNFLSPLLIQIPLLGLLIWLAVGRSLSPLTQLSTEIANRRAGRRDPIALDRTPAEIRPLVSALNDLNLRQAEALERQRRFTSDAAHELRTPLAAIQLQADLLAREDLPDRRAAAKANLRSGIERAAHLTSQLLAIARSDAELEAPAQPTLQDLGSMIATVVALQASLADARGMRIVVSVQKPVAALCTDDLLVALNSVIDNAIRYGHAGGKVSLQLFTDGNWAVIEIADNGPGIASEHRTRVFDRFYRVPGSQSGGSGLGLAIAKAHIEQLGGTLTLADNSGQSGLKAILHLRRS